MLYSSFAGLAGGVSASLIPSVYRIVRALPISQVSLPFSRSMTNRRPVPEVSARSFCVTPSFFRVSLTILPRSFWRVFHRRTIDVTVREHYGIFGQKSINYYRTGILRGLPSTSW